MKEYVCWPLGMGALWALAKQQLMVVRLENWEGSLILLLEVLRFQFIRSFTCQTQLSQGKERHRKREKEILLKLDESVAEVLHHLSGNIGSSHCGSGEIKAI